MAPKFDALKSVVPQREAYRFLVRIDRLWVVPGFTKPDQAMAIEMVFLDQHGDKIQATVRKTLVYKFVDQLKEGVVYRFAYFGVVPNTGSYRATHHEHKLVFQMRTTVQPCESSVIPRHGLCCVPFAALLKYDKDSDFLIDVIGVLSGISTDREYLKDGKVTKMLVLELTDSSGKIECTLFGDFADQIKCFIEPGNIHPPVIVLLYAKVKLYRGSVVVQNSMHASKLLINPEIAEVMEFMDGLKLNGIAFDTPMNLLSGPNHVSVEDDYLKLYPKKTLFDLGEEKEEGVFVVFATIAHVSHDDNWWYPACKCHKSVTADNGMYYCSACRKHVFSVVPRFKVKFEALDDSGVANLFMFDYDVAYLLKKTCSELLAGLKEESLGGCVPDEFDALVGKKLLFKVTKNTSRVSTFGDTYRVAGVCDDEHIISMYELNGPDFSPLKASLNSSVGSVINLAEESLICGDAKKEFVSGLLVDFSSGSDPIPSDTIESSFCKRRLEDDYEGVCCGSSKSIRIVDVEKKEKVPN